MQHEENTSLRMKNIVQDTTESYKKFWQSQIALETKRKAASFRCQIIIDKGRNKGTGNWSHYVDGKELPEVRAT